MNELPDEEILWMLSYIQDEGYVNMNSVQGVKNIAQQLDLSDLVEWIEEKVEIGSGHNHDFETWLKAVTAAATGDRKQVSIPGTTFIHLDTGGEIRI